MSDYISREDALLCATGEYADDSFEDSIRETECKKIAKRLNELKPADVRENIHGEWIKIQSGDIDFPESIVCSKCHCSNSHLDFNEHDEPIGKIFIKSKFCPNCGADMRGKKNERAVYST